MNKKLLVTVIAIIVIIAAAVVYLMSQNNNGQPGTNVDPAQNSIDQNSSQNGKPAKATGVYTDYDESKLASAQGTKVIFFYAPWCPQCRALEADIQDKGVPEGVTIFKIDYDSSQELRQKYGVTIQTTLVKVDGDGNLIKKFVANDDPTLESVSQNLLQWRF